MKRRDVAIWLAVSLGASVASAVAACNTTQESVQTLPPVTISGLPTLHGLTPDGGCSAVLQGATPYIAVEVNLTRVVADAALADHFVLRPPGTCQGASNCGSLSYQVLDAKGDPIDAGTFRGATQEIDLPAALLNAGATSVRVTLVDDFGNPWAPLPDAGYNTSSWRAAQGVTTIPICPVASTSTATDGGDAGNDAASQASNDGGDGGVGDAGTTDASSADAASTSDDAATPDAASDAATPDASAPDASDAG